MSNIGKNNETDQKETYKVINWSTYNQSLVRRGDLTIWIDEDIAETWLYTGPMQQGSQYYYSDACIEFLLNLKVLFRLPYRQTEGFGNSLLRLIGYDLDVPSYTQICRRAEGLEIAAQVPMSKESMHLVMDSTGLKIYGEGEWKVRKHGVSKRRTWRKLHLAVDERTGHIHASSLTENGISDASQVPNAIEQIDREIDCFSADGAYDTYEVWSLLHRHEIEGLIPPQRGANYWTDDEGELLDLDRNKILQMIDEKKDEEVGRQHWKKNTNYHRRSISENSMFRFKTIFGNKMYSRKIEKQKTEAKIKVKVLNRMTACGMPISVKVA